MQAIIMAGGKGTRLSAITGDAIPKPLVALDNRPLIFYLLDCIKDNGITDILIIVGHLGRMIEEAVGDGSTIGLQIRYIYETEPLGTAGGLYYAKELIHEDFLLVYADLLMDIDIGRMHRFHVGHGSQATLFVHPNAHPFDSDLVICNEHNQVIGFDYKGGKRNYNYHNCVNAGVFLFSPNFLEPLQKREKLDLESDLIEPMVSCGGNVYAYASPEFIKDVGTPERLLAAQDELRKGIVEGKNLSRKQKCVFLDRDGVINAYKGLITQASQIELAAGAAEAIHMLNQSGYLAIIVTNQPVVARGDCTFEKLDSIHCRLTTLLGNDGAYVDAIYFCPHHPDSGYAGEVTSLKIRCDCRKPNIGMINSAATDYNIDIGKSWLIGDTYRDIQTAGNAGLRSILINSGAPQEKERFDSHEDYVCFNLYEAVKLLLNETEE